MKQTTKLETLRKSKGLTQSDLAAKVGVAQQYISSWEKGTRTPALESLKKLAAALDCKIDDLV